MANVVVVGAQWGDEGKGKIVDWLSIGADVVVRFQGGHNAGHTLVIDGKVFKLALLPSGIVRSGKLSVIGNGVVLDPYHLVSEIEHVGALGVEVTPDNLKIAENVPLILSLHRDLDARRESGGGGGVKTRHHQARHRPGIRGQGRPTGHQAHGSGGTRTRSTTRSTACSPTTSRFVVEWACRRRAFGDDSKGACSPLRPRSCRSWRRHSSFSIVSGARASASCSRARRARMLDVDHGTYPFVTSSNTVAANAATGSGLGPGAIGYVLGIAKAYVTRVGGGPFPTELDNEIGRRIGQRGAEFGTNTGRPRRCGWFDAVLARQAVRTCGIDGLALTKLDILDGFEEINVATGYRLDGREIHYLPASQSAQARIEPIYETIEGWQGVTSKARSWNDLPAQAIKYVRRIEELVGAPVALLSTSPERNDTILVRDPFQD